jgi:organic hydroperoxide reductase OsmC/OhrA
MDMHGQPQRSFAVQLRHEGGYRFSSQAVEDGQVHGSPFPSDEPDPVGEASAPSTPALLGAALGHCLSASLLETLRHAHIAVDGCETEAVAIVAPNDEGLPRIDHVDVTIRPRVLVPSPRQERCERVFQRHCTVTSSVREGIDVRVQVDWQLAAPEASEGILRSPA